MILLACLIITVAPQAGFAQEPATHPALNKYCPVMTEEEADPDITTVYKGRTIAFCCDNCLTKFNANPERYFARLVAMDEDTGAEQHDTHAEDEHPTASHNHDDAESAEVAADHNNGDDDHTRKSQEDDGHQHGAGDDRPPLLARMHPVIVHFPVAGVPLALLGFLAWVISRKPMFALADAPPLAVAALASVAAVITGNMAHDSMRFSPSLQTYAHWHQYAATTVMILLLLLSTLRLWRWSRLTGVWLRVYGVGLVAAALLVGLTGYLGGSLVFGPDHLAW